MAVLKLRDKKGNVVTVPSITGQSAYQVWLDSGNTGTEEDFFRTLVGRTPIKGIDYWTEDDKNEILDSVSTYIDLELASLTSLKPEFANDITECKDTSKLYVLPDGYIYAYMYTLETKGITTEKQTGGYWQYLSDEMQWQTNSSYTGWRTNLISVTAGDSFTYIGYSDTFVPGVLWFDSAQNVISTEHSTSEIVFTAPSGAAYARFYSYNANSEKEFSVTYISEKTVKEWKNTGCAFVPADYEDRVIALEEKTEELDNDVLKGKKIVYDGDSICESRTSGAASNGGAYAKIIADMTGGNYSNHAVGGGRIASLLDGYSYHSVVDNLGNLPDDGDLYCFEGGINDYWTPAIKLGSYDYDNFDGELDITTFCGALETIFRYALNNFLGKPICFVITHKIQSSAYVKNNNGNTFKEYRDAAVGICEKYSIPYYDAFSESGLNGWNDVHNNYYLNSNYEGKADGCHPNAEGYKRYYVPQLLSLFRKIMPKS